ncbi:hypothetical protein [Kitasatospora sp. NPDC059571]|uniref:hypothetical protein n=1 Tax=Kitasatospora sp. NPDC059571 TaxID=3346871 RepID=UPI0036B0F5D0
MPPLTDEAPPVVHAEAAPVFVDQSGTRGRRLRGLGWLIGLASTMLAAAMTGSLVGLQSHAPAIRVPPQPSSTIPVPSAHPSGSPAPSADASPSPGASPGASASGTARPSGSAHPSGSARASGSAKPGASHSPVTRSTGTATHKPGTTAVRTGATTTSTRAAQAGLDRPGGSGDDRDEDSGRAAPAG